MNSEFQTEGTDFNSVSMEPLMEHLPEDNSLLDRNAVVEFSQNIENDPALSKSNGGGF